MKCSKCGSINTAGEEYCNACGNNLNDSENQNTSTKENRELGSETPLKKGFLREKIHSLLIIKHAKIISLVTILLIIGIITTLLLTKNVLEMNSDVKNKVVVKIGKEAISESIFKIYLSVTQAKFEAADPNVWKAESDNQKALDTAKDTSIKDIKLAIAAKQKIKALGIKLTDEELKGIGDQATDIMAKNVDLANKLNFEKKDLEEFIMHGMYVLKAVQEIGKNYTPTEAEINAQLEQVKARSVTATVKHVLIMNKDEESKKLAEDILKKALSGENMAELAKNYSEDPGSKDIGGEYTFPKGQMVKEFEDAAFTGEIGKVYPKLVETSYGYHIMKIEKRDNGDPEQIKKDCETIAKNLYAQDELVKMSDKLSVKTTKLYDTITSTK